MTSFSEHRVHTDLEMDPGATAVLVIDMLNDFLDPNGAMPLLEGRQLFEPINRLTAVARSHGCPVIWLCDEHLPDDTEFDKRDVHCLQGSWGAEIVDELSQAEPDVRIGKHRYSGFFETGLDAHLKDSGVEHLVLAGVVTNICVRSTAHDAFFHGYGVIIPEECVAATSEREQASSLYDIDTHFGTVTNLDTVVDLIDAKDKVTQQ